MPFLKRFLTCTTLAVMSSLTFAESPFDAFNENSDWNTATAVSVVGKRLQIDNKKSDEATILVTKDGSMNYLAGKYFYGDALITMEYLLPQGASAKFFIQGHYAFPLSGEGKYKNNEWQSLTIKFRAPRFNEASEKTQRALIFEARINGEVVATNQLIEHHSEDAFTKWESAYGQTAILANQGPFAFRKFTVQPVDYSNINPPVVTGEKTNIDELVDYVAMAKDTFESVGCNVCHSVTKDDTTVTTGPNLFGLFTREPRSREVVEGGEGHRFNIKATQNTYTAACAHPRTN